MYKKFAALLQRTSKTAYQVSKDTGIPQSTLSDWKNGRSTPKVDKLKKIADYFGVPLETLLEENGKEEETENAEIKTQSK